MPTHTSITVSVPARVTLTRAERDLCLNRYGMIYQLMHEDVRKILDAHNDRWVQVFNPGREGWSYREAMPGTPFSKIRAYRIDPAAPVVEDFTSATDPQYEVYPARVEGNAYWYADGRAGFLNNLFLASCRADFAGFRYDNSPEWRGVLDTVAFGEPKFVRFRKYQSSTTPNTDAQ